MTTELTKAAQQALERLKIHKGSAYCNACEAEDDEVIAELERALNQRPAAQTERGAFEAEMRCEETWGHRSLKKRPDGRYQNWQVDVMWDVWQARASLPAPQQAVPMTDEQFTQLLRKLKRSREVFQAGRDSYETACAPMNTDDEAWFAYLAHHGITAQGAQGEQA